ncbi:unnamed protein product [Auanema sp. JU1783]|nr:unnamed protein product [Auanema sp. JU1783]
MNDPGQRHSDKKKDKKEQEKKPKKKNFIKRAFLREKDDEVEDVTHGVKKDREHVFKSSDQNHNFFKDTPAYRWSMNIMTNKTVKALSTEFSQNKRVKPQEYSTNVYSRNETKNRYNDILCMDSTRVVLKGRPQDEDYIHASWMTMQDGQKYICTQGPMSETLEDFWHMVYTEKSCVIVMLCGLIEANLEKCARYFPKVKGKVEEFGQYRVSIRDVRTDPIDGVRHQILECELNGQSLLVHHLIHPSWPDHVVPENASVTVNLFLLARKLSGGRPITVHCSAGIGRTATFVGLDYASQKIRKDENSSMVEVLRELRTQRFHAIQSPLQYIFLHVCIIELFALEGLVPRKGKFQEYMDHYDNTMKRYAARQAKNDRTSGQPATAENK